jgi:ubiquinone biosynthesis protein UbiJ
VKGIELNGTRVDVRENLWSALVHLRDSRQERGLWIDALCINQGDIEERNHQVKLMAFIFARAEEVLVWLGPMETPNIKTQLERASENHKYEIFPEDYMKGQELKEKWRIGQERVEVSALCNQPYWKRVWIVQEIGAATKLKVHWGSNSET